MLMIAHNKPPHKKLGFPGILHILFFSVEPLHVRIDVTLEFSLRLL